MPAEKLEYPDVYAVGFVLNRSTDADVPHRLMIALNHKDGPTMIEVDFKYDVDIYGADVTANFEDGMPVDPEKPGGSGY